MTKRIIVFERSPILEEYVLSKIDAKIYFLQEKEFNNKILNKLFRLYLMVKFFLLIFFYKIDLVISTIYNSKFISKLIKKYKKLNFLIIQHHMTVEYDLKNAKNLELGNFLCFGEQQHKSFLKFGYKINSVNYVGAPIYSIFRNHNKKNIKPHFKICYVSQWTPTSLKNFINNKKSEINECMIALEKNLYKFLNKYKYNYVIACREKIKGQEFDYFKNNFSEKNIIINNTQFNTYKYIDDSEVVISFCSTCAYEVFADNKKVLFAPYFNKGFQIFKNENCVLENSSYEVFEKKLNQIIDMTNENYKNLTFNDQNSIISNSNIINSEKNIINQINKYM